MKTATELAEAMAREAVETSGSIVPVDEQAKRLLTSLPLIELIELARAAALHVPCTPCSDPDCCPLAIAEHQSRQNLMHALTTLRTKIPDL